jgi:hypothetical protein
VSQRQFSRLSITRKTQETWTEKTTIEENGKWVKLFNLIYAHGWTNSILFFAIVIHEEALGCGEFKINTRRLSSHIHKKQQHSHVSSCNACTTSTWLNITMHAGVTKVQGQIKKTFINVQSSTFSSPFSSLLMLLKNIM